MPFINVKSNLVIDDDQAQMLKEQFGKAISLLPGKNENYLMVGIEEQSSLYFQGDDGLRPAAMLEVALYGGATSAAYNALTEALTGILQEVLFIEPSRVYIRYTEHDYWGHNGRNF